MSFGRLKKRRGVGFSVVLTSRVNVFVPGPFLVASLDSFLVAFGGSGGLVGSGAFGEAVQNTKK